MRYAAKWPIYARWWDAMTINASRAEEFASYALFAIKHQVIYQEIADATKLPWHMIAVIHRRESNAEFDTYLGNGQSLSRPTTEVPRGRGPFVGPDAFRNGAIDAVRQEGWISISDWRLEKELFYCEAFNGPGYDMRRIPSPYLWGGTNIQTRGKYVADGRFDPEAIDHQPGCAPILKTIATLESSVQFVREAL